MESPSAEVSSSSSGIVSVDEAVVGAVVNETDAAEDPEVEFPVVDVSPWNETAPDEAVIRLG